MKKRGLILFLICLVVIQPIPAHASQTSISNFQIIFGNATTLDNPAGIAVMPDGDIWLANWNADELLLFSANSEQNVAPKTRIQLPGTLQGAVAVDSTGFVYASANNKIYVFAPGVSSGVGESLAVRKISLQDYVSALIVDSEGFIYAITGYGQNKVFVFAPGTTNDANAVTPVTFYDSTTADNQVDCWGTALLNDNELAIPNGNLKSISFFPKHSSGATSPSRIIRGGNTMLEYPSAVAFDSLGRLYVAQYTVHNILVFEAGATGDVAPIGIITGSEIQTPWGMALSNSKIWFDQDNYYKRSLISFSNPFYVASPISNPVVQAQHSSLIAALEQARVIEQAKTEIKSFLTSGKPLTAEQLQKAQIKGVTTKNIGLINDDIAKIPYEIKADIKEIEKVVLKFATVDRVAEGKSIYSSDLIAVGLISQESKIKSTITSALRKLPSSSLDSYEKIQAAVASVEKQAADRKARLESILAKKR